MCISLKAYSHYLKIGNKTFSTLIQLEFFKLRFTISQKEVLFTDQVRLKLTSKEKGQTVLESKVKMNTKNVALRSKHFTEDTV